MSLLAFGCAHAGGTPITVVLSAADGPDSTIREELSAADRLGFNAELRELPQAAPSGSFLANVEAQLNMAERLYLRSEYASCVNLLSEREMFRELLTRGRRGNAARLLYWRIACRVGQLRPAEARADADLLVSAELNLPPGTSGASQEAEDILDDAFREAQDAPRAELMLNSAVRGTHVGVDGRMRVCQAPCNLQLLPGHHVVVFEADGFSTQVVNVELGLDGAQLQMTLNPASPSEASDQWTARYSGVREVGGEASLRLLAQALGVRDLVLLQAVADTRVVRLTASVVIAGERAIEQSVSVALSSGGASAGTLVRDVLEEADLLSTPLYRKGWFWGIVAGALVAGGVSAFVLTREEQPSFDLRIP